MSALAQARTHAVHAPAALRGGMPLQRPHQSGPAERAAKADGVPEWTQQADTLALAAKVLGSAGQPLDPPTRALMSARFGCDLSGVRVHHDAAAAHSAAALQAQAYTFGNRIVFGEGRYRPHQPAGRWLLAHELAHTRQQDGREAAVPAAAAETQAAAEAEADRAANLVTAEPARLPSLGRLGRRLIQRLSLGAGISIGVGVAVGLGVVAALIAGLVQRSRRLMHWETKVADAQLVDDPSNTPPTSTISLPENTRLVVVDEGANQPFNRAEARWVQVRVAVGPFANKVGWVQRSQIESRPETAELTPEQANEVFAVLSHANIMTNQGEAPIPFHYPPDGCYSRAHRMEEMLTEMGYASEKVFALAGKKPLVADTPYGSDVEGQKVTWAWHVAPIVKVRDPQRGLVETVIDPSLYERPITLEQWEGLMGDSSTYTRLSLSQVREQMRSGELGQHERVAVTAPRYTYNPGDLQRDETRPDAESEDVAARPRITAYTHEAPVHELAAFIRRQLRNAVVSVTAIIARIRSATHEVRQLFRQQFMRLLNELRQRIAPTDASQVDQELNQ
ncbi:MAG: DUF4157 domain-containing protein [Nevskia sp.]|nr:DUF4157 domain-containing protein [Nevskia sp.]